MSSCRAWLHTGGQTAGYTQPVHEGCDYQYANWPRPAHGGYDPDSVVMISDGLCGSTCSVRARTSAAPSVCGCPHGIASLGLDGSLCCVAVSGSLLRGLNTRSLSRC